MRIIYECSPFKIQLIYGQTGQGWHGWYLSSKCKLLLYCGGQYPEFFIYFIILFFIGGKPQQRRLEDAAVPSVFKWKAERKSSQRASRLENRRQVTQVLTPEVECVEIETANGPGDTDIEMLQVLRKTIIRI